MTTSVQGIIANATVMTDVMTDFSAHRDGLIVINDESDLGHEVIERIESALSKGEKLVVLVNDDVDLSKAGISTLLDVQWSNKTKG